MRARARDLPAEAEVAVAREQEVAGLGGEMAALAPLPPLPPQFKSIQHHLRTAQEHDKRDPVVAYYCECFRAAGPSAPPGPAHLSLLPGPGPASRPRTGFLARAPSSLGVRTLALPPVQVPERRGSISTVVPTALLVQASVFLS